MRSFFKQGQSILEYTVLLCVVLSALLVMHVYVKRGYQGRIKQEADEIGEQYAPNHTASFISTNTTVDTTTWVGGTFSYQGVSGEVPLGSTLTVTTTNSTFRKMENVSSFATED